MEFDLNNFLVFLSTCILTKGTNRTIILDGQRNNFVAIPETMNVVLEEFKKKKSINEVIQFFGDDNKQTIFEYIEFLIDYEFAILVDEEEFDNFIEIDTSFEMPAIITNCIIENPKSKDESFEKTIKELIAFNCQNIQIVFYELNEISLLIEIVNYLNNFDFRSIDLIIPFARGTLKYILEKHTEKIKITNVLVHSTPIEILKEDFKNFSVNFIENKITNFTSCGVVSQKYFTVNKLKVLESINHNSCLHKKLAIDKDGNVKNCPAMGENFGNIKDTSLHEAVNKSGFKKYWNITKDQIEVCKDCEFRHICTDCRAFVENPEDQYSKPLKCGYSPYTNVWEEWSTNPLKEKAIQYYGMQQLVKKQD